MAEALGLVASGISIASIVVQVIESSIKLKAFWNSVKNGPNEIASLVDEIQVLSEVTLQWTSHGTAMSSVDNYIFQCLRRCQSEMASLSAIVDRYDRDLKKNKKWSTLRLGLNKEVLATHQKGLERAKTTLIIAQQLQSNMVLQEISSNITILKELQNPSAGAESHLTNLKCVSENYIRPTTSPRLVIEKRKAKRPARVWVRPPSWLTNKMWAIQGHRAHSGMNLSIRTYNVVENHAPIFLYASTGNILGLYDLLHKEPAEASVYDCNETGWTALHFAAQHGQIRACRLLLENGAESNVQTTWGATPLGCSNDYASSWIDMADTNTVLDLYRIFLSDCDPEAFQEDIDERLPYTSGFSGPPGALEILLEQQCPDYRNWSLQKRFEFTMKLDRWWVAGMTSSVFRKAMGEGSIDPAAYHLCDQKNETLLFFILERLAVEHAAKRTENLAGWRGLLADAVSAGTDLHKISTRWLPFHRSTPLCLFIKWYTIDHGEFRKHGYDFTGIVRLWVTELKDVGVDLVRYGERHLALFKQGCCRKLFFIYVGVQRSGREFDPKLGNLEPWRLINLKYGPSPDDWEVWISNPRDEFAGDFWRLVEEPELKVPGSWVD